MTTASITQQLNKLMARHRAVSRRAAVLRRKFAESRRLDYFRGFVKWLATNR